MVLDKIIEMELDLLKNSRIPSRVFMNIHNYNALIRELETDRFFQEIHNMKIEIITSKSGQLIVL